MAILKRVMVTLATVMSSAGGEGGGEMDARRLIPRDLSLVADF